ncbi:CU044_2847 family protein [Yinghuangia sp. YIM S10712]|uniref:CU044_2847 family protein n=1 Tax=Yinghuangia sp. YIM S10712 TaxID=3436930 RepID=UPI003F53422C
MDRELVRVPLEDGGAILFETVQYAHDFDGPVRAGRVGDAVRDLPQTLQQALAPVGQTARAVLAQLRRAEPAEVEIEFGIDLSASAGVVVTKAETAFHIKVRVLWNREADPAPDTTPAGA